MSRSAVGDLLKSEILEKQAHSTKYQLTIAKLPLAKDIDHSTYKETPINEALVRDLAGGNFIAQQRKVVMVGGTGEDPRFVECGSPASLARAIHRGPSLIDLAPRGTMLDVPRAVGRH